MQLTELAKVCQDENRWEFFFAALPWRMVGVHLERQQPGCSLLSGEEETT